MEQSWKPQKIMTFFMNRMPFFHYHYSNWFQSKNSPSRPTIIRQKKHPLETPDQPTLVLQKKMSVLLPWLPYLPSTPKIPPSVFPWPSGLQRAPYLVVQPLAPHAPFGVDIGVSLPTLQPLPHVKLEAARLSEQSFFHIHDLRGPSIHHHSNSLVIPFFGRVTMFLNF